jgi:hypothetical protein
VLILLAEQDNLKLVAWQVLHKIYCPKPAPDDDDPRLVGSRNIQEGFSD